MLEIFFSQDKDALLAEYHEWIKENQENIVEKDKQLAIALYKGASDWFPEKGFALMVEYDEFVLGDKDDRDKGCKKG